MLRYLMVIDRISANFHKGTLAKVFAKVLGAVNAHPFSGSLEPAFTAPLPCYVRPYYQFSDGPLGLYGHSAQLSRLLLGGTFIPLCQPDHLY